LDQKITGVTRDLEIAKQQKETLEVQLVETLGQHEKAHASAAKWLKKKSYYDHVADTSETQKKKKHAAKKLA
jgi:hypothetical protein